MQTILLQGILTATWRPTTQDWQLLRGTSPIAVTSEDGCDVNFDGPCGLTGYEVKDLYNIMERICEQFNSCKSQ